MDSTLPRAASAIDPKVAARAGKGDHLAFSQLYDQSSTMLFSLAVQILGSQEDAAEVLQDVYADVWRKAVRYDVGRGTPIAWLLTLTRSRAIERLRTSPPRIRRQNVSTDDAENGTTAGQFESPADQAVRTVISTTLADLPQAQRQALELSYYEGLPSVEVATRLSQPLDTVTARIRLGMVKLRESLHTYWEQDKSA
ncbi:MAG: sigma-70 family RNA polymerase sigma factor [Nitrospira sp.]|nr:sigma-70 family RNA polymerase sigma factor [Nitrospira sp.]MDH4369144.1 sigma-70 family RNA polymerase sigma factor [Nitrospira sp.]MDH5346710.1 sigma-70 family RNA polymerase sigma factor [Nitrospira sp.]MDH5498115.1 sigma-70 family RNA polymerase sigma factor [Nitrospira sp.]MDH5725848.1 sigma-70 family RNA polymerase sigma factor [Nitrospira sp.]